MIARGNIAQARQSVEKALALLQTEIVSTGGRDPMMWDSFNHLLELLFITRVGVSTNPFRDKTKEVLDRISKKEGKRLADDPSAAPIPDVLKSRMLTLQSWCTLQQAEKKLIQERRHQNRRGDAKRLLTESRDTARSAFRLDPSNWRAAIVMSRVSRELKQTEAAAKILHVISESIQSRCAVPDRQHLELALLREGAFSLAALRPSPTVNHTKLLKAVTTASEQRPDDVEFLIELAATIQDPSVIIKIIEVTILFTL